MSRKSIDTNADRARIGSRIRELRESAGMTQQQLADAAGMGRPNLARLENGKYGATLETLSSIANALGVQVDFCEKE